MRTLVDSNILIDVLSDDLQWARWSTATLAEVADEGQVVINPLIYAEVSTGFPNPHIFEEALAAIPLLREALPWEAAFMAGKAFLKYRRGGGKKSSPLPDFYIGAHAAVAGMALLTRDEKIYRKYFPKLRLISPKG